MRKHSVDDSDESMIDEGMRITLDLTEQAQRVITDMKVSHVAVTQRHQESSMWNKSNDGPATVLTEHDIEQAIGMIVALTRNLLSLDEDTDVDVHVRPQTKWYNVTVEVAGFVLRHGHKRMACALEAMLADLSSRVHARMEEAARLLDRARPTSE